MTTWNWIRVELDFIRMIKYIPCQNEQECDIQEQSYINGAMLISRWMDVAYGNEAGQCHRNDS